MSKELIERLLDNRVTGFNLTVAAVEAADLIEAQAAQIVMLRDWIRQQGEVTNTCTFNILKEVCNECACHRAKEQR